MLKIEVDKEKIVEIKASGSTETIVAELFYVISVAAAKMFHDGKDDEAKTFFNMMEKAMRSPSMTVFRG